MIFNVQTYSVIPTFRYFRQIVEAVVVFTRPDLEELRSVFGCEHSRFRGHVFRYEWMLLTGMDAYVRHDFSPD